MAADIPLNPPPPAILLLEDRGDVRVVVAAMLKRRGVTCDAAASLAEARRLLVRKRYDILIVDVNLPDGRGLSVLAPGRDAPLAMVMTGDLADAAGTHELRPGTDEVIAKPFGLSEFLRHFDALFEHWRVRWKERSPRSEERQ